MKTILFSKMLKDKGPAELVELALSLGIDGYDLAVRPGHPVDPENAAEKLPELVSRMRDNGLDIPMVTANFDLVEPGHPTARPILGAMDRADVRLLKLGYFWFRPAEGHVYLDELNRIRRILGQWEVLSREYGVKVCYHSHSGAHMGMNCASLVHMLTDFDPQHVGAYLDPAHMLIDGEEFALGLAMVRDWLSIVALKDVLLTREEKDGHGSRVVNWVEAGRGMVDWSDVFAQLAAVGYDGPLTIHCEFKVPDEDFSAAVAREVAFFRRFVAV